MNAPETAFIGDIHGCASALAELLEKVTPLASKIVMLGDYGNRGMETKQVFDILVELTHAKKIPVVLLEGNHDEVFRSVLIDPSMESDFLRMGGSSTVRSYVNPPYHHAFARLRKAVPQSHISILESLQKSWAEPGIYATHELPSGKNRNLKSFAVAGHSIQQSITPRISERLALIDTGSGTLPNGRLTAFFWPSKRWIQVEAPRP